MNLLITSVGSNTAISVIKALRIKKNTNFVICGTDSNPRGLCAGSTFVDFFFQIPSSNLDVEYEASLIFIINKYKIDLIIPIHDNEIVLISKLKSKYPNLLNWAVNDLDVVDLCNNKKLANELALKNGIKTPKTYDISQISKNLFNELTIIAKPCVGVSSMGIYYANNFFDIDYILNRIDVSNYIFQRKVLGIEYTVDCYSNKEGCFYGGVVRERIEVKSGIAVKSKIVEFPRLLDICKVFLNSINYKGASNLQFIVEDSDIYFIEINPRFSGAGILSYKAGFNSPLFTINEALNIPLLSFNELYIQYNLCMSRYWEEVFSNE